MAITPTRTCDLGWFLNNYRTELIQDDFFNYTTGGLWTTVSATGTAVVDDTSGTSKVLLTTAASDNNYCGVKSTIQWALPAAAHPIFGEAVLNYTNQSGSNANVMFGFSSNVALGITDGSNPTTSASMFLIYKVDGGTTWKCHSRNGSTSSTSTSSSTAVDGTYRLRVDIQDVDGVNCEATYRVNGKLLQDSTTGLIIKHTVAYSGLAKMNELVETQAGSGNAQTCYVDYMAGGQLRAGF